MKGLTFPPLLLCASLFCASPFCAGTIAAAQDAAAPAGKPIDAAHQSRRRQPQRAPAIGIPQPFTPPQEAYASFPETAAAAAPAAPSACQLRLAKLAQFQPLPLLAGPGECGAVDAVLLQSVTLPDRTKVAVEPPATLRCPLAEELAHWLREDVAPAALKLGAPLRGVDDFDSYECRGRNRVRGAILSEHGRANAIDVRALKLADGRAVGLTDVDVAKDWRDGLRRSACARFSTVLGPGSDGHHEEHIHLDLAERRGGYKTCQWDVREPPPPPPPAPPASPAETADAAAMPVAVKIEEPVPLPRPRPPASGAGNTTKSKSAKIPARLD